LIEKVRVQRLCQAEKLVVSTPQQILNLTKSNYRSWQPGQNRLSEMQDDNMVEKMALWYIFPYAADVRGICLGKDGPLLSFNVVEEIAKCRRILLDKACSSRG
jgi:hypothetical protein